MADYTFTPRWNRLANGSVLTPDHWAPHIAVDLPSFSFWPQFLGSTWGPVEVTGQGKGAIFYVRYISDEAPTTTPLTQGTMIAASTSTAIATASGTIKEYGHSEDIENFTAYLSDVNVREMVGVAIARHAMNSRNSLVGSFFTATLNRYECNGTETLGSAVTGSVAAGTNGTSKILPYHIEKIVDDFRRKGIPPFPDGYFRCVGRPGAFTGLKNDAKVYASAADLGMPNLFHTGQLSTWGGVLFLEEMGQFPTTTWNGTESSSVIFGANPVIGFDNFNRGDLVRWYPDHNNDYGREGKAGWIAYGGYCRPLDTGANGRVWRIFHGLT